MADTNVWKQLDEAKADLVKRAQELRKKAFIEMPGGQPPPGGDPAAAGGMPPEMAGAMPPGGDPAAMGAMPPGGDPAAMGAMDPAMMAAMGGAPLGVDPATAGMLGAGAPAAPVGADAGAGGALAGAGGAGTPEPTITISLSQLWDVVTKVLGLAKKIGANGQGVAAEGAAPAQPAGQDAIKAAVIEALGDMGLTR